MTYQERWAEGPEVGEPLCECGTSLEGQYNNGEEYDECAVCREGRLCDEAYEREREGGIL